MIQRIDTDRKACRMVVACFVRIQEGQLHFQRITGRGADAFGVQRYYRRAAMMSRITGWPLFTSFALITLVTFFTFVTSKTFISG